MATHTYKEDLQCCRAKDEGILQGSQVHSPPREANLQSANGFKQKSWLLRLLTKSLGRQIRVSTRQKFLIIQQQPLKGVYLLSLEGFKKELNNQLQRMLKSYSGVRWDEPGSSTSHHWGSGQVGQSQGLDASSSVNGPPTLANSGHF